MLAETVPRFPRGKKNEPGSAKLRTRCWKSCAMKNSGIDLVRVSCGSH